MGDDQNQLPTPSSGSVVTKSVSTTIKAIPGQQSTPRSQRSGARGQQVIMSADSLASQEQAVVFEDLAVSLDEYVVEGVWVDNVPRINILDVTTNDNFNLPGKFIYQSIIVELVEAPDIEKLDLIEVKILPVKGWNFLNLSRDEKYGLYTASILDNAAASVTFSPRLYTLGIDDRMKQDFWYKKAGELLNTSELPEQHHFLEIMIKARNSRGQIYSGKFKVRSPQQVNP